MESKIGPLKYWNGQVLCPRCDYQGTVCRVQIKALSMTAFICDECDALWLTREEVGTWTFVDYETFTARHGLQNLWTELDSVEKVWTDGET